jgi:hypothetical protein
MKDFGVESEEWWEVAKEYFTKHLKKNLVFNIKLMREALGIS